jgi:hypothetical protein
MNKKKPDDMSLTKTSSNGVGEFTDNQNWYLFGKVVIS